MADLRPCFTYKYGVDGKIGVRLQIYGHTVVIEPVSEDAHAVRVLACRRGLEKLRKFHPRWILPPQPMDCPSGPEWSWVQMLQCESPFNLQPKIYWETGGGCSKSRLQAAYFESDYCQDQGYLAPQYVECLLGSQCFCDVIVQGQLFRSARPCITLKEA
jgi:hypothetical protein